MTEHVLFHVFQDEHYMDLNLYQAGWERCRQSQSFGPAIRNHYLFHYVISGKGILDASTPQGDSRQYQLHSGQGFLIAPGQVTTYIADAYTPWEYVWVEFDGLRARQILEECGFQPDAPVYRTNHPQAQSELQKELMHIVRNSKESMLQLLGHMYLALDILLWSSVSRKSVSKGNLRDFYIHEAILFIEQNYQNPITVEDLAATCGWNRSYFGKMFKKAIGKTPQEFLLQYRMNRATELLHSTSFSIGDIGKSVGYENPLHFSRAFKNVYGVSPREWRLQHES